MTRISKRKALAMLIMDVTLIPEIAEAFKTRPDDYCRIIETIVSEAEGRKLTFSQIEAMLGVNSDARSST